MSLVCALLALALGAAGSAEGFGIEHYGLSAGENGGAPDKQAGSHPYELTAEVSFGATGSLNELQLELPPGVTLNPNSVPRCTFATFLKAECTNESAVGVAEVSAAGKSYRAAVYNLAPAMGEWMAFGLTVDGAALYLQGRLRPAGYGTTLELAHAPPIGVEKLGLVFWGAPGDAGHDGLRGKCATGGATECPSGVSPEAFVTLPTACSGNSDTWSAARADSWQEEATWVASESTFPQMTGCEQLAFGPSLEVSPDVALTSTPSGYQLNLRVPQDENPKDFAVARTQSVSVTLPVGAAISVASANGLQGCQEAQFAAQPDSASACPDRSKVGTVEISTPLVAAPLRGYVFLAEPHANPSGALVGLYVAAEDPVSGVMLKLAGQMALDASDGQPTLVLEGLPQLPVEEIKLHFFGGQRALLMNPPTCGASTSDAVLVPWSGSAAATPSSFFEAIWGHGEGGCPERLPFTPALHTAPASVPAGSYGSLVFGMSVQGVQQDISQFAVQLPAGIQWRFSNVQPCAEPEAGEGACPSSSQIGDALLFVGYQRLAWFAGPVYLTEGYAGAPHGLSIAFNATAGPLDLGELVVRASVGAGQTGSLTIASGRLPSILDGIPLHISALEIGIDGFILNSPICESAQIGASVEGSEGTSVQTSSPYSIEGCQPVAATNGGANASGHSTATSHPSAGHEISHVHTRLRSGHIVLKFTMSKRGLVVLSGGDIRPYSHELGAGAHKIELSLTRHGRLAARHRRHLHIGLTLNTGAGPVATRILVAS